MTTTPPAPSSNACCKRRLWLWVLAFLAFYVVTVVPVGLGLYVLKSDMGWDVFKQGGYHKLRSCLAAAVE